MGPLLSLYPWQGRLQREEEYLLLMKTAESMESALIARLQELHPYEVPEILVLPIAAGNPAYLAWIAEALHKQE
jgi:periplasmic divalent cation tolerance protein